MLCASSGGHCRHVRGQAVLVYAADSDGEALLSAVAWAWGMGGGGGGNGFSINLRCKNLNASV